MTTTTEDAELAEMLAMKQQIAEDVDNETKISEEELFAQATLIIGKFRNWLTTHDLFANKFSSNFLRKFSRDFRDDTMFTRFFPKEKLVSSKTMKRDEIFARGEEVYKHFFREFPGETLYELMSKDFTYEEQALLFESIYRYFNDINLVTDEVIFGWEMIAINLMNINFKLITTLLNIDEEMNLRVEIDAATSTTNLILVREKHIFHCFIGETPICYFKEGGAGFYLS